MIERAVEVSEADRRLRLEPALVGDTRDILDAAEFFVAVERERARSRRSRLPYSLLVATVDEGAAARVAQILRGTLRGIDVVGRIDRARVAVLLPYTTEEDACSLRVALTRDFDPLGVDVAWGVESAGMPDGEVVTSAPVLSSVLSR